jgi:hypothetical protein
MNQPTEYRLPANLLQAIVGNLNTQAAGATRPLLNAIEALCTQQDAEAEAQATDAAIAEAVKAAAAKAAETAPPAAA